MTPRELGGAISSAKAIFVWVPYTELEPEAEVEVETTQPAQAAIVAEGETEEEAEETEEEAEGEEELLLDNTHGHWLAVTRVQAREMQHAAIEDFKDEDGRSDVDIVAEEHRGDLYIGMGPLP